MPSRAMSHPARDQLVSAALSLIAERGLRAVTARAVADLAGQSPSATNYYFEGRDGLLTAAFSLAATEVSAWRTSWSATLAARPPASAFRGWFLAHILSGLERASAQMVLRELRHHAARSDRHRPLARQVQSAADHFWGGVERAFGLKPGVAEACADFSEAILGIHGGPPDHPDQTAWLIESAQRVCARLQGARGEAEGWDGWRQRARGRSVRMPDREQSPGGSAARIAAAAADVLGREGMEALTHRAAAGASGLSLASVSGHFPTRVSLVQAAFDHLIGSVQAVREGVLPAIEKPRPPAEVLTEVAQVLFDEQGAAAPGLLALDELLTAAVREPELRRDAEDLRASRGENSAVLLARIEHRTKAPDGLDAHLLSIVTTGAMRAAYALEPDARRLWLAERLTRSVTALFA
ncbi:MAG: TetR family transcriptional regulator [Caulobacteraceae bacterium]|nr:TetR family transcriptional regulator [Caulobacteraceae bacterium]